MGFLCSRRGHPEKAQASSALCFLVDGDCWRQGDIKETATSRAGVFFNRNN